MRHNDVTMCVLGDIFKVVWNFVSNHSSERLQWQSRLLFHAFGVKIVEILF